MNIDAEEAERLRQAIVSLPPECASSVGILMQVVASYATNVAAHSMLEFIPVDKRREVAYTIADTAIDAAALVGRIFTATETKDFFGWGRTFNVNRANESNTVLAPLLQKSLSTSPLDLAKQTPEEAQLYRAWTGPFRASSAPTDAVIMVSLPHLRDIVAIASTNVTKTSSRFPEGSLTDEEWEIESDLDEGLQQLMATDVPLHLGYQFSLGPTIAVHHALYFGTNSGPDGGLVLEVMNRKFGPQNDVQSFIAPSTLLNFMRRTATNGINGILVYNYKRTIPMELALDRAMWAVGKFDYNVVKNNCENFVSWVLQNINSNTTCASFKTMARAYVTSQLNVRGGKTRRR